MSPTLVSYPRTGSHWLRLALKLYFGEQPFHHTHDLTLTEDPDPPVVYLWRRDTWAVIHSYFTYERWPIRHRAVRKKTTAYRRHIDYWSRRADLVVTYEEMEGNLRLVLDEIAGLLNMTPLPGAEIPSLDYLQVAASTADSRVIVTQGREDYVASRERLRR